MPRVSIILPVRNPRIDWLEEAIESVRLQTMRDWELLVIVDDRNSLAGVVARFNDDRIRHLHLTEMPGLPAALNRGVEEASAALVARLDADDICEPDRLEKQLALFDADPKLDVAGTQLRVVDAAGNVIGERRYPTDHDSILNALLRYNALGHPSVMFRRQRVIDAGGYPMRPMEDYDLWCALAVAGARFANHRELLVRYRYVAGLTRRNVDHTIRATIAIKLRHFSDRLTLRARFRIWGERLLLALPNAAVNALFRMTQFRRIRAHRGSRSRVPAS